MTCRICICFGWAVYYVGLSEHSKRQSNAQQGYMFKRCALQNNPAVPEDTVLPLVKDLTGSSPWSVLWSGGVRALPRHARSAPAAALREDWGDAGHRLRGQGHGDLQTQHCWTHKVTFSYLLLLCSCCQACLVPGCLQRGTGRDRDPSRWGKGKL